MIFIVIVYIQGNYFNMIMEIRCMNDPYHNMMTLTLCCEFLQTLFASTKNVHFFMKLIHKT